MRPLHADTTSAALVLTSLTCLAACNHVPIATLDESFTLKVEIGTGDDDRVAIDFLWVIDNSSSMCQEQAGLARGFATFAETLDDSFDVDARIAVTSVTAQCQGPGSAGAFNTKTDHTSAISCGEEVRRPCGGVGQFCDDGLDCATLGRCDSDGKWACHNRQPVEACIENSNETFNESCRRTCTSDAECQAIFGDAAFVCVGEGALADTGCVRKPPTDGCPDDLPSVLVKSASADTSALFPCLANVGLVGGSPCFHYEEPLRSAWMALDPTGLNAAQADAFLRPGAYLVIIIVSDEEDCSVADDEAIDERKFGSTAFDNCGFLGSIDQGGPLVPVSHFVNRFKSLKSDPSKVIVATIVGDTLEQDPAAASEARQAYVAAKTSAQTCHSNAYICESTSGVAGYGSRLLELADAFGPNGIRANICSGDGIERSLVALAGGIAKVVNRMCLPKPILGGLVVELTRDGTTEQLAEGEDYEIIAGAEDCAVDGQLLPAISFTQRPQAGDAIDVVYQGDAQLE